MGLHLHRQQENSFAYTTWDGLAHPAVVAVAGAIVSEHVDVEPHQGWVMGFATVVHIPLFRDQVKGRGK